MFNILDNLIIIDLDTTDFKDMEKLLTDNGLNDFLDYKSLCKKKKEGVIRIYIDPLSYRCVAIINAKNEGQIIFDTTFYEKMLVSKSINFKKVLNKKTIDLSVIDSDTIDIILEKIMESGIDSLDMSEKEYLDKYSK